MWGSLRLAPNSIKIMSPLLVQLEQKQLLFLNATERKPMLNSEMRLNMNSSIQVHIHAHTAFKQRGTAG